MSKLFLSCASDEFGHLREMLVGDLRRPNVEVKSHGEIAAFNSGETTLEKLDTYIAGCDAVVHLVGDATGSAVEQAEIDAISSRHPDLASVVAEIEALLASGAPWRGSYSQWEAYLALYHIRRGARKRLYLYRSTDRATAAAGFLADATSRQRQLEHWERFEHLGRDRDDFGSREDLRVQVLNHLLEILSLRSESLRAEPSTLWKLQTKPDSVFEGREKVLADLDKLWADALSERLGRARIVSLVAIGGGGKTTVASRWKDALLARDGNGGVEQYFDWSFYSQGTRREGDNASAQTAADATVFVAAALKFFGDPAMADSAAPAWDKGARLAALIAPHRTLLILDGLEPLQHPPGPQTGELKDDAIRALLAGLQTTGRGLCLVTTRESITDLASTRDTSTPEWRLDHLTDVAGALVLRRHGVTGPEDELQRASADVKGHALTLSLMGRYLHLAFDPPDIARRDCFGFATADQETSQERQGAGRAFRVFAAYERWFESEGRHVELAILNLLGLFDRPATPDCLVALSASPTISGLTEPIVGLGDREWNAAVQRLRDLDLVETSEWVPTEVAGYGKGFADRAVASWRAGILFDLGSPQRSQRHSIVNNGRSLDAHPLLREYFGAELRNRGVSREAHTRLYEHLRLSVPYWPEGRDGLLPLYDAVAHGCRAGLYDKAFHDVFLDRICRGYTGSGSFYSGNKLGLSGLNLAAVASFFSEPWHTPVLDLAVDDRGWLLHEASYNLVALNRLTEAVEPLRAAVQISVQYQGWIGAAGSAQNLAQLEQCLGNTLAAVGIAAEAVAYADRAEYSNLRVGTRCNEACALHQSGNVAQAALLFAEAEQLQAADASYHVLYGLNGYQYSELLLDPWERMAWRRILRIHDDNGDVTSYGSREGASTAFPRAIQDRAQQTLGWSLHFKNPGDIGLNYVTLARLHLVKEVLRPSRLNFRGQNMPRARAEVEKALGSLRKASNLAFLIPGLLPSADVHAFSGEWDRSRERLDEAYAIATRSGKPEDDWRGAMRLYLADVLLRRARLFGIAPLPGRPRTYPWRGRRPADDLAQAERLIDVCDYYRRRPELADAKLALTAQP